jgi:hypothetical protein
MPEDKGEKSALSASFWEEFAYGFSLKKRTNGLVADTTLGTDRL